MARAGCRGFILLHGVQTANELYYKDVFTDNADAYWGIGVMECWSIDGRNLWRAPKEADH